MSWTGTISLFLMLLGTGFGTDPEFGPSPGPETFAAMKIAEYRMQKVIQCSFHNVVKINMDCAITCYGIED